MALPVLLFKSTGKIELMASLHKEGCQALNLGGRGNRVSRFNSQEELAEDVLDLVERGFPVRRCKCLIKNA